MRISFAVQKDATLLWVNRKNQEISKLANAISSGKRIAAPSDDPVAWAQSIDLQEIIRDYDQISSNVDFASGWGEATDDGLNAMMDCVSQAQQIAIQATGSEGLESSDALAQQLDGILQEALSAANSKYNQQYIFGGTVTGTAPYSISDDGEVVYNGDDGALQVRGERGSTGILTVNIPGSDAFDFTSGDETCNVLHEIWELRQAVSELDTDAIAEKLTTLEDAYKALSGNSTVNGARLSSLENRKNVIELLQLDNQDRLSSIQDTDTAEAAVELEQQQTAYSAALSVISLVSNLNLTKYL